MAPPNAISNSPVNAYPAVIGELETSWRRLHPPIPTVGRRNKPSHYCLRGKHCPHQYTDNGSSLGRNTAEFNYQNA